MRYLRALAIVSILVAAQTAHAHDLTATKLVNGQPMFTVTTYPTTLHFTFEVADASPTLPSTLLTADDPLLAMHGFSFMPAPPQTIAPGNSITYSLDVVINNEEDCRLLGLADNDPSTPGAGPDFSFSNTFHIGWDTGAAQSSTLVTCKAGPRFTCDRTLYITLQPPSGGTTLNIFDPVAATLTPINSTPLLTDALGFDPVSGYMYALSLGSGMTVSHLVRFDSGGNALDLGPVTGLPGGASWTSGTFLQDGTFLVYGNSQVAFIDVSTVTATRVITTSRNAGVTDWAVNPLDGKIYGYDSSTVGLVTFDPAAGTFTRVGPNCPRNTSGGLVAITAGAAFFQTDGTFYVYAQNINAPAPENTLYKIDIPTCTFTQITQGPSVVGSDGATCAFASITPPLARGAGYYAVHEHALASCLVNEPIIVGSERITSVDQALGILWADPTFVPSGYARSAESVQALRDARQALLSVCDARLASDFEAGPATPTDALARARKQLR